MEYEIDQIVQFAYLHQNVLYVMVGKIVDVKASSVYKLAIASDSNFPHTNQDGSEVETIDVPLRMMGRIVPASEPSTNLVFNWKTDSRIGWLAKVSNAENWMAIGRIIGVSFNQDNKFTYYVALKRKVENFEKFKVDRQDARGGIFAQIEAKKQVIGVSSQQILDSKNVSEKQRTDVKLYQETYHAVLKRKIAALNLVRRVVKVVHDIKVAQNVKLDHHNEEIRALHDVKENGSDLWYAFTTDDHHLSYETHLREIVTKPGRKDFIEFMPSEVDFHRTTRRPESRDVILTRAIVDHKERANPPVAWMFADDEPGFDVFNTYFQTNGQHKIFTDRRPAQIISMCEERLEDGSRVPTLFSKLLQGYFHKGFQCEEVDEFREQYLWFFA